MIRLENVTKEYDAPSGGRDTIVAADRLNLFVPPGEIFGLIGPNGAGKTTTLKMVCGLTLPTSGRITVNGIDVEQRPEEVQKFIGYLADFFSLYDDLKVWEYLDYFARAYKVEAAAIPARIDGLLRQVGLEAKRDALIHGLSRGMKQRLGIGRALVHDPPLLILDEPAAGLDTQARVEFKDFLRELHGQGKTIFITSHILSDLEEICTSIAIIEKGKLARVGKLDEVLRAEQPARRIRIRLAADGADIGSVLANHVGVTALENAGLAAEFSFTGSDTDLAEVIRALVGAGAPVCGVEELREGLERVYLRIAEGQTS